MDVVIDIGARGGVHRSFKNFPLRINYVQFEPDPIEYAQLKQVTGDCQIERITLPNAISNFNGEACLNIYSDPSLSSLLELNKEVGYRHADIEFVKKIKIKTQTLDNCQQEKNFTPLFLTIDAQGLSYEILEGAKSSLRNSLIGIRLEVEFQEIYKGQRLFGDVDGLLRSYGFSLQRFERPGPGTSGISTDMNQFSIDGGDALPVWADAIYLKESFFNLGNQNQKTLLALSWLLNNGCGYKCFEIIQKIGVKQLISALNELEEMEKSNFLNLLNDSFNKLRKENHNFNLARSSFANAKNFASELGAVLRDMIKG